MKVRVVAVKLFGIIALFLIALIGVMLFLQTRYFGSYYVTEKKNNFKTISTEFARDIDGGLYTNDDELLSKIKVLKIDYGMIGAIFDAPDDSKKIDTSDAAFLVDQEFASFEILASMQKLAFASKTEPDVLGEPQIMSENGLDYLVVAYPITFNGKPRFFGAATSLQPVDDAVKALNSVSWLVYAFAIACSLALAILISVLVARPLIREIEKEKALDRMRKEFIANASHEMKTPISIISGYIETMRDGLLTPDERQEYELAIQDETQKMGSLVRDMLEMALLQNDKYEPRKSNVDIYALVCSVLHRFNGHIKDKDLIIELDHSQEPLTVSADERMLELVLVNFLTNAINHTQEHGTIHIRMDTPKEAFHFEMENDGTHIPEESLPHVWEAFYRVDKSHNREAGRFGLGLSIVKMIIDKHGGTVGVQNTLQGVRFFFDLPYKKE